MLISVTGMAVLSDWPLPFICENRSPMASCFLLFTWLFPLVAPLDSVYVQRTFPMSGNREKLYAGLPEFIADSLPDHWGNVVFQKWMEANHLF